MLSCIVSIVYTTHVSDVGIERMVEGSLVSTGRCEGLGMRLGGKGQVL